MILMSTHIADKEAGLSAGSLAERAEDEGFMHGQKKEKIFRGKL